MDPTPSEGKLRIILNQNDFAERRSLDDNAINFFKSCKMINEFRDGLQVYVGLLISVISLRHKIILLDEPEAFLHPPKARTLGRYMTTLAADREGSLIVSTHSPDFLLGCLDESTKITISRLTYNGNNGTTHRLDSDEIKTLTTDPLLRSSETISALFHSSSIISEADKDRVFYAEINRRLSDKKYGIDDVQFLNSQGKHTIHRIFGPLRKIGIPTAAIYDLDVIKYEELKKEKTTLWRKIMECAHVPGAEQISLDSQRQNLQRILVQRKNEFLDPFKKQGISILTGNEKTAAKKFLKEATKYGIFIVPTGDVESWSQNLLNQSFEKGIWLVNVLEALEDKHPELDGTEIKEFFKGIKTWIENPNRLGVSKHEE